MKSLRRFEDLSNKAWKYLLEAFEQPRSVPPALLHAMKGVHLGEFLKLNRTWIRKSCIQTVIDIGSHTGEFASAIGALLPGVQIYAFEPLPDCYDRLQRRLKRYPPSEAFNVAIGDESREVQFWRSSFSKSSSVLPMGKLHREAFSWTAGTAALTVPMVRLDDYLERMILRPKVLLKIDVQGYENKVLCGGSQILRSVDYVMIEVSFDLLYEAQASFDEVYRRLVESGFSYAGNLDQLKSPLDDRILQADALFVAGSKE
jgi:FkbM family methyltransferase